MPKPKKILIIGATGHQGEALVEHLQRDPSLQLRAGTRDPSQGEAQGLANRGVEVVRLDMEEPETIKKAASGVDVAFFMTTPYEEGPEAEVRQGKATVDALKSAGVWHVVYSSVADADKKTGVPIFDSKLEVEEHLRASGLNYTIVGPAWFRENLLMPGMREHLEEGMLSMPLAPDTPLQNISLDEIGAFLAYVIEDPDRFAGSRIDIASDENTPDQMAQMLSRSSGREVHYKQMSKEEAAKQPEAMQKMFAWFEEEGYDVPVGRLRSEYPEIKWRSFKEWANTENLGMIRYQPAQP